MVIQSVKPSTEEVLATFPEFSEERMRRALDQAQEGYERWRRVPLAERGRLFLDLANLMRSRAGELASLITAEMGKPIVEAEAEIEKCAWNCEFFAENSERFLRRIDIPSSGKQSYVVFQPLGIILGIMPWNFPFWQVFRYAVPALMAGNTTLLKHASNVPQCSLAIEEAFREAGFPDGVLQSLLVRGSAVEGVMDDARVRAVTLTGSDKSGSAVAQASGRALKKSVLELGGSDPFIVLADADLHSAARTGARARNQNSGQSCIAAKRFIVVDEVAEEFTELLIEAIADLQVGDPADRATQIGPLARSDLREDVDRQVRTSIDLGAELALGGRKPNGKGFFYLPTVLTGVTPEMPAFREEAFGPLAAVVGARDADHAIELANDSSFGLGASVWSRDVEGAEVLAQEIETGMVFINGMVVSDPRLPFGGVKRSGYGRELSEFGPREFVNVKTVWVGSSGGE